MIPDIPVESIENDGERVFYAPAQMLSNAYTIFYSYKYYPEDKHSDQMREADFVIVHPMLGYVVVEVKQGEVNYNNGQCEYKKDGYHPMHKDPLEPMYGILSHYKIAEDAKIERTNWEDVIDIFNRRFFVPFKLTIKNKVDAILNDEVPSINYFYEDRKESVEEVLLHTVLSQGEKRALYLLNIIFEIESRKKQNTETLFIIDDIADSFDYKNKYAIIEYLKDMAETNNFYSIILTHNFDFFRTIQNRIGMNPYKNCYMALKEKNQVHLNHINYKYINNPFSNWKENLTNNQIKLIASITFARNIAEYIGDTLNYNKLTSLLHIKHDTNNLTIKDLEITYREIFKDLKNLILQDHNLKLIDLIFSNAEKLNVEDSEIGLNLENKIVLSIAIRLNAEKFMISKIDDNDFFTRIKSNQTVKLYKRFKTDFIDDYVSLKILEKVNLMTPENIHLNSFMYEPILDISDYHLKQLYDETKQLLKIDEQILLEVASDSDVIKQ